MTDIALLAKKLDDAAVRAQATAQISENEKYSLDDAYKVQAALIQRRIKRGERRVGVKMGFTSRAKIAQMGISDMIWGRLTDRMVVEEGGEIDFAKYVHPRVEPEIAFLLGRPLEGLVTAAEALEAIDAVAPAMEIIDSRYKDFKFSLEDVVADNASSAGFVVGAWRDMDVDLSNLGMVLEINGRPVQIGSSGAILGHPIRSLVAAARLSSAAGEPLEEGWIVMAGGATAAEWLHPGDYVRTEIEALGPVAFSVKG